MSYGWSDRVFRLLKRNLPGNEGAPRRDSPEDISEPHPKLARFSLENGSAWRTAPDDLPVGLCRMLFEHNPDAVYSFDQDGKFISANPGCEAVSGYAPDELLGTSFVRLLVPEEVEMTRKRFRDAVVGEKQRYETTIRHKRGHRVEIAVTNLPVVVNGRIVGVSGLARDITKRKEFERRLKRQTLYDDLTGLPNRSLFHDRLEYALERVDRVDGRIAVLYLGLDRFKLINESLGHAVGDELLTAAGQRIRDCFQREATVARVGGDEFGVLLEGEDAADQAREAVRCLMDAFDRPFDFEGIPLSCGFSIGTAVRSAELSDAADLLRYADVAMYQAKDAGGGHHHVFNPARDGGVTDRLQLEADLRNALELDQFTLQYQPVVELDTRRIVGAEALIRWEHPERGTVSPGEFIPLAEETGMIVPIGEWVVGAAASHTAKWVRELDEDRPFYVGVNVSPRQFQDAELPERIENLLQEAGLCTSRLRVEVTESVALQHQPATEDLRQRGVPVYIDDVGTGYASLEYLTRINADAMKIDRTFVAGLGQCPRDEAIVDAIILLGKRLGLELIGEGIETEGQLCQLRELGCEYGQGYLFSRPVSSDRMRELLAG